MSGDGGARERGIREMVGVRTGEHHILVSEGGSVAWVTVDEKGLARTIELNPGQLRRRAAQVLRIAKRIEARNQPLTQEPT